MAVYKLTNGIATAGGFAFESFGTVTGAALAATLNTMCGVVTTEGLTTAAAAEQTYTITNSLVTASDIVIAMIGNGTNTTLGAAVVSVTPGSGSFTVSFTNVHAASALNGTLKISFVVIKTSAQ